MKIYHNFLVAIEAVTKEFINRGKVTKSPFWQAKPTDKDMFEVYGVDFSAFMTNDIKKLQDEIKPNLPWADIHFKERISGIPLNPGESYKEWPFYGQDKDMRKHDEKFSHTYMERFWPKRAGYTWNNVDHAGIRYNYGDLQDIVNLLVNKPDTRQAYLPVWFPEDTGNVNDVRVPCSLGYLFTQREGFLHVKYYIRSCDYLRHFRDDIYLTAKLVLWIIDACCVQSDYWKNIKPGIFSMDIASLHIFALEKPILEKLIK